ncbi:MAG TPA: small-conductance mechanosensitive ion channel [Candidatus Dormibacteraeota bacterium]|nr:small-conductance mechanosensitive ion channel [Candidatus Dormibacteraeota bacterium]
MSVPTVSGWFQAVMVSITGALMTFLSFIPALIGAILILIIGWLIAGWVGKLVTALLEKIGFERAAERTGVSGFMSRAGVRDARASRVIGELVKWFIRLIFLEAAAEAVHLTAVTVVIERIVLFIPNLIVAVVVLMIGALIARFVGDLVRGGASEMGFGSPNLLATISRIAVMAFAVIVAVNQIGIAAALVNTLFMAVVFALALAVGLAFGLGGRDTASQMWEKWYARGQEMAPQLEQRAELAAQRAEEKVQQTGKAQAPATESEREAAQRRYRVSTE